MFANKLKNYLCGLLVILLLISLNLVHGPKVSAATLRTTINNQSLTEGGGSLTYTLKFPSKPSGSNDVRVTWSTDKQCTVAHEGINFVVDGQTATQGDSLVFAAKAVDDADQESTHSCSISYKLTSGDSSLNNLQTSQNFTIIDNGDAAATIPALYTTVTGPSSITEGSSSIFSFGIGPSTKSTDSLTISAGANDGQCQLVSGSTTGSYFEQTIPAGVLGAAVFSVRSLNDSDVEGDHSCTITHTVKTNDKNYSGQVIVNTQVPINDDEAAYSSEQISSEELFKRAEFGKLDGVDANNDGIEDKTQRNLGVFINQVSGRRQAIEIIGKDGNCNAVSTPKAATENQQDIESQEFYFPHGLLSFKIICDKPGAIAKVNLYLDDLYNTSNIQLQKYSATSGYQKIEGVTTKEFKIQKGSVSLISYELKDGGMLDEDEKADSVITDPVGIAISETEPQTTSVGQINNAHETSKTLTSAYVAIIGLPVIALAGFVIYKKHLRKPRKVR